MSNMQHLLIVDDDADIRALLRILLGKEGYLVTEAADGIEALHAVEKYPDISLILLDIMMPRMDGFATSQALRARTDAPILFLTARSSDDDRVRAYAGGGDDYIVKPFHATDLRLKIRAMLARYTRYRLLSVDETAESRREIPDGAIALPGEVTWYPAERKVCHAGETASLTEREYALFCCLAEHRGENLTPAALYEQVWGEPYLASSSNTVIVHIANLRHKLERDPAGPVLIRTVWGKGYRID